MKRRTFLIGSLGTAATLALGRSAIAMPATPGAAELQPLALKLTDTGFEIAQPVMAGRYEITVTNSGTSAISHFALGKIPEEVTEAEFEEWLAAEDDTAALSFDDIGFVGVPDWPAPGGGTTTGVVDLAPGRYILFDPLTERTHLVLNIEGELTATPEPAADVTVLLKEMTIDLPEAAFTSAPRRWKIDNQGGMIHEMAIVPIDPAFTEEDLHVLFTLPDDATPPPGVTGLDYQPVKAIGLLAKSHASWLDVQLAPGHYAAFCMAPFGTGYPHAVDGMYRFFNVS
jgi:hypothetical protein